MRQFVIPVAAVLLAAPSQALACMSDPVPNAVIFAAPPKAIQGAVAVNLTVLKRFAGSYAARVRINEGPSELAGREMTLVAENLGSCTTLGRNEGYAVVRRIVESRNDRLEGRAYDRRWYDRVLSFFGVAPYYAAGSYEPPFGSR